MLAVDSIPFIKSYDGILKVFFPYYFLGIIIFLDGIIFFLSPNYTTRFFSLVSFRHLFPPICCPFLSSGCPFLQLSLSFASLSPSIPPSVPHFINDTSVTGATYHYADQIDTISLFSLSLSLCVYVGFFFLFCDRKNAKPGT